MWLAKITTNIGELAGFLEFYNEELKTAKYEVSIKGNLEKNLASLPGITEQRFAQLQEIEAVLGFLNIQLKKIRRNHFQKYLEGYSRALSARDAEKYVDGEEDVIQYDTIINEVALLRNRYLAIMKGLETKSFMVGHITRLRTAGLEDVNL